MAVAPFAVRGIAARRARLAWYALGLLCAWGAVQQWSASFVPAPGHEQLHSLRASQAAAAVASAMLVPADAWAKGGAYGPLEGKASSLVHPAVMLSLFLVTLYAGFLGWQWRQTRLIGAEIIDLRKQLPAEDPEKEMTSAQKALKAQIEELSSQRSELTKGQYKDKHYQISSVLLGGGIFFTLYGTFNTWFRTEKLFPGPHLFAGAGIVALWALAAALVPYMEKGNETARNAHIALNVVNLTLFTWQLFSGWEILEKVWGKVDLPWF